MEITNKTALVTEPVHGTIDTVDKTPARAVERVVYAGGKYYMTTEKDGVQKGLLTHARVALTLYCRRMRRDESS